MPGHMDGDPLRIIFLPVLTLKRGNAAVMSLAHFAREEWIMASGATGNRKGPNRYVEW